ncbi:excinuclease ABC subunit UvrA [Rhodopirellula sp. MGV]|uniref:excinuclease ABC subunit UvrA n=1 Tax=Rhodopirellula sp. MGV TaxID=2023130 RepID=UPI000B972303|nr:excinuclease ABC subunit UvrA [Rhodopirellula sp. MGV]OYP39229.1 excinuclease ABC subunit A [Rhodopirellula sp. MGV]PNY35588.1 excinuclease ABC subunit A [Rhodopirellula baltica]
MPTTKSKRKSASADATISLRGCRVHNLKDIDLDLPRGKLIAFCGLSGSGKTSLALDTLYAEGQRCYIESFSAYTRQFLQRLDKPDCDSITGIPPAVAVTRASGSKNNRSTVATATEIADHLRLLFAKCATLYCVGCGKPVTADDPTSAAESLHASGKRAMIGFPIWLPDRKSGGEILLGLQQDGFVRIIVDGVSFHLSDSDRAELAKKIPKSGIECIVVVDRVSPESDLGRLTESIETAMGEGHGRAVILTELVSDGDVVREGPAVLGKFMSVDGRSFERSIISDSRRCDDCDLDYPDPVPRLFNFNNPLGACEKCEGFGELVEFDMDLVVPDKSVSIRDGAIAPWSTPAYSHELEELLDLADDYDVPVDVPFSKLTKKQLRVVTEGVRERKFGGLDGFFAWLERKKYKMHVRVFASRYRSYRTCDACDGKRFKPTALAYRVGDKSVADLLSMSAADVAAYFDQTPLGAKQQEIAKEPMRQIDDRIGYLRSVGLGYLELDRPLRTLSGGETQRVALTSALGGDLVNMLYVLDEPTAGLHPVDVEALVDCVRKLCDRGNTVIVVEHNEIMIKQADHVVEIGPGAGARGGEVVFQGTSKALLKETDSLTGQYLTGKRGTTLRSHTPREPHGKISLCGASGHNLQNVDVEIPLGVLCVVTGVSGSGKSSLVQDTLLAAIQQRKLGQTVKPLPFESITGLGQIQDCVAVDQSPISRSPRSCPVTFLKAFDPIRKVFAESPEAKARGLTASHFTFNSSKGQCPACEGAGVQQIDMQFLADVAMQCPECRGTRFRDDILKVRYRDRTIADVLAMTAQEAYEFFRGAAKVQARLKRMIDVGIGYLPLGQSATTLSSGEGQRLKLAAFLASASRKKTLFVMDEPTTGLHFDDLVRLVDCFDALIADGHSLLVVEHNPLLMLSADHIIDLGPGAGKHGGQVVAVGTPEQLRQNSKSQTGRILSF